MALTSDVAELGSDRHVVRFYEDDDELGSAVGEFLAAGLRAGGAVIVVADPPHTALIEGAVAAAGID
ncbi:MAG TPA: MEDS domain-containing protein, partial [Acidimicrobiales bacterium]